MIEGNPRSLDYIPAVKEPAMPAAFCLRRWMAFAVQNGLWIPFELNHKRILPFEYFFERRYW